MKRLLLVQSVILVLGLAIYFAQQPGNASSSNATTNNAEFKVAIEDKNPWTSIKPNNAPENFQFVVVTDRTGGHRAKIFSRAVKQVNLLQPEFVISVGDLIEGYTTSEQRIDSEWDEFDSYVKQFTMPFFYVPGNHDLTNKEMIAHWGGRYGRKYYHFVYQNVLFMAVNSEDGRASTVTEEQAAYFKKAVEENPNVRWTMVFLHKPLWTGNVADNGWGKIEEVLAGKKYTVFCGHVHRYQKYVRNGMNYYQLATTGGGSRLRGVKFGEFDHIVWITMKNDGPLLANVMLEGVYPESLEVYPSDETGVDSNRKMEKTFSLKGLITKEGQPVAGASVGFFKVDTSADKEGKGRGPRPTSDGVTNENGELIVGTYKGFDGIPAGSYIVTVTKFEGEAGEEGRGKRENKLPARYASPSTSPLRVTVQSDTTPGMLQFDLSS